MAVDISGLCPLCLCSTPVLEISCGRARQSLSISRSARLTTAHTTLQHTTLHTTDHNLLLLLLVGRDEGDHQVLDLGPGETVRL